MSRELLENKELQALISSLGTEDEEQPLGKYGRMAMEHLHNTAPQRFSLLKMQGQHMSLMYRADEEATEQVENLILKLLEKTRRRRHRGPREVRRLRGVGRRTS
jgi:hypothetical protein